MSARANILRRLREAERHVQLPTVHARPIEAANRSSSEDCLLRFQTEARMLGVSCYVEPSAAGARARLAMLVEGCRVASWDSEHLPYEAATVLPNAIVGRAGRAEQALAEVGVTGCDAAVAETASLVILSGPGRSRAISLLPPFHVAIVEREKLCCSMSEAIEKLRGRLRASASCTVITGPSRTADIELTLTLGIHGPGRVAIIIGP